MIYAQIKSGHKLHLALEGGEVDREGVRIERGMLSHPLCGQRMTEPNYRMTINVPLANACRKCRAIAAKQ
ncbi:MAG TPA: hypothetical protein VIR04_00465 [Paralcaligenes sp.]